MRDQQLIQDAVLDRPTEAKPFDDVAADTEAKRAARYIGEYAREMPDFHAAARHLVAVCYGDSSFQHIGADKRGNEAVAATSFHKPLSQLVY
jgi:hypothetical protein